MGILYSALKPVLFRMDPEEAHDAAARLLSACQSSNAVLAAVGRLCRGPARPVRVAGLEFPNPVGLAAGFDKDARLVRAAEALGFGFVEVGTVTPQPQPGNPKPRMFRYPEREALVNRLGFNSLGAEAAARALERTPRTIPVGVNVGKNASTPLDAAAADYAACVEILHAHADYFTLNISSPNTADLRRLHEPDRLKALLDTVGGALARKGAKPLFLKVSPDASPEDLSSVARAAVTFGCGLIATNTTVGREGLEGLEDGGLSGRPLKAKALAALKLLKEATGGKVPLIGVGGISDAADARERLDAGADLLQLYSALIFRGPGVVKDILRGLEREARA